MSKVICDVCGTSYPETSTQCPICGCVRPVDTQNATVEAKDEGAVSTYKYVKGGRFSKANVRKRNANAQSSVQDGSNEPAYVPKTGKTQSSGNTGLIITIFVLLLAILAVVGYIVVKFFVPSTSDKSNTPSVNATVETPAPEDSDIVCQQIELAEDEFVMTELGAQIVLDISLTPADTTDQVTYTPENPEIVSVEEGVITAISYGDTVITIKCGEVSKQCIVSVKQPFALDAESVVLTEVGAEQVIYSGEISVADIEWSSDDEDIATVSEGVVTAVSAGTTTVYGEHNGEKLSCFVTCDIPAETVPAEPTEYVAPGPYKLKNVIGVSSSDVSLSVGERFILVLLDANGNEIDDVKWSIKGGTCCTVDDGYVKAVASGQVEVVAEYNGETFTCVVRVR